MVRYCYKVGDKLFYFGTSKELNIKHNEMIKLVLEQYKIPQHLTNVRIVVQSLKEANKGLVFKGQDSKARWQYFYGKEYTVDRSESRIDTLEKVHKIWDQLLERISILTSSKIGSQDLQIGLIMFLLTKVFIRTGKHIHYRENKTQGLITLKTRNFIFSSNNIMRIKFVGKDNVNHDIALQLTASLYKKFKLQSEWVGDSFMFSYEANGTIEVIKEFVIYEFLDEFNIRPKDVRTYGANIAFLESYLRLMKESDIKLMKKGEYKKLIATSIEEAAKKIGHTKNVSKRSYICIQLHDFLTSLYDKLEDLNILTLLKKTASELLEFFLNSR